MNDPQNLHRIGAVAALSGVPVSTLRVWETRYGAFSPLKTSGQHRLYSQEDVLRAGLLRQLTEAGHAISTLARHDVDTLSGLLHQQRQARARQADQTAPSPVLQVSVVGLTLAARLQSPGMAQALAPQLLKIDHTLAELPTDPVKPMPMPAHAADAQSGLLLVQINSLHLHCQRTIEALARAQGLDRVVVLYRFAPETTVETLKATGILVRREPISDAELAALIRSAQPLQATGLLHAGRLISPPRYSEETLARMASIQSPLLCECPRHVAELITQLASFEQYSQDCLHRSAEDAELHAYLCAVSGSARALFEQALAHVAAHEGIALEAGT